MRLPYLPARASDPIPSLGGALVRYRPVFAVRVSGPNGSWLIDGLLDTGADDTVFEQWVAALIGVDLTQAEVREIRLVGRPRPIRCSYARVQLSITDGLHETYEWEAVVGFVAARLRYPLLGHAGCLQFLDVTYRGADLECILSVNGSFAGRVLGPPPSP